jgi:hypothetical protein
MLTKYSIREQATGIIPSALRVFKICAVIFGLIMLEVDLNAQPSIIFGIENYPLPGPNLQFGQGFNPIPAVVPIQTEYNGTQLARVHLYQTFDNTIIGYRDARLLLDRFNPYCTQGIIVGSRPDDGAAATITSPQLFVNFGVQGNFFSSNYFPSTSLNGLGNYTDVSRRRAKCILGSTEIH